MSEFDKLHPAIQYHVVNSLGWSSLRPTQLEAIEPIQNGRNCLLLAPTAGGKTEAAIIPVLSRMLMESWSGKSVVYVCPIKALLNNLEARLSYYAGLVGRTVEVWHGDISASRKRKALLQPPDIMLTTPESLEGMLISPRVQRQEWFGNLRTVIVDELHAFASDDRGWHLRSVLSRLDRYAPAPLQRIGLSATVSNPEELLAWLSPSGNRQVVGSSAVSTDADVTVDYVGSLDNAATVISRLHRGMKRLVFCDSRSSAEQLGNALNARGVRTFVSHASLSLSERRQSEKAFESERDCVIVATSTLELGIDVGDLDHVIQIDAPGTVSSFLQRMGRTGRRAGGRRNCLFLATSENALLLTLGITEKWSQAWVEAALPSPEPWNVVAQQALLMCLELGENPMHELLNALQNSFPELDEVEIAEVVDWLVVQGYLYQPTEGLIQIGAEAESEYGRAHYRDLLATFTGPDLLTAKHGSTDIGYVDPMMVGGDEGIVQLLLAGRSWFVREVDWKRRVVWLEPASGGGKARWMGGSRSISAEVASGIREALRRGAVAGVMFSKRALAEVSELGSQIPTSDAPTFVKLEGARRTRLWTYFGTKQNAYLQRALREQGAHGFDELSIDFNRDPRPVLLEDIEDAPRFNDNELDSLGVTLKFGALLPRKLIERELASRLLVRPKRY